MYFKIYHPLLLVIRQTPSWEHSIKHLNSTFEKDQANEKKV